MEAKGLEFAEYVSKESLAQQGGFGLALKGLQHDEAWLIFLDMVHNFMPTFEQKAEALHWFPMFRIREFEGLPTLKPAHKFRH